MKPEYFDKAVELPGSPHDWLKGYRDVENDTYHAFPALSAGLMKEPSAAHMLHYMNGAKSFSEEAKAVGTLTHWAVLEPHKIRHLKEHVIECTTKTLNSKAAEELRLANPGKLVITGDHLIEAVELRRAVAMSTQAGRLLAAPGVDEASGFLFSGGVWRKWRPDRVQSDHTRILDVKTTRFPLVGVRGKLKFISQCWELGYFIQAAWYLHHHELATGFRPNCWTWIVVSKDAPYHCRCFTLDNRKPTHPLYAGSALQKARQLLGLEPGNDVDRLAVWMSSAGQTDAAIKRGQTLSPETMRALWPACEDDEDDSIGDPINTQ